MEKYIHFFQPYHLSRPLAPLQGEIDMCPKFDAEELLFEAFFGIMHIFGSVHPKSECNFLFLYNLILNRSSFEPPNSTPGGDRQTPSRTFLSEIQCRKTFI